jgi:hypothetical protein
MPNFNTLNQLLNQHHITIPLIQRDYAQGRDSAVHIRKTFLSKLKKVFQSNEKINLDFIYGYIENNRFFPLDGQQRLTTLWLIHWYFSLKEQKDFKELLSKFSYQTRISSERFCKAFIENTSNELLDISKISEAIKDASWFMSSWKNDPTILAMLNMVDAIHQELYDCESVCEKLIEEEKITFDFIDIRADEFKLTDELYIKMNSRGKPLTDFENFKAQFSDLLSLESNEFYNKKLKFKNAEISYKEYFAFKIDTCWTDLFWSFRKKTKLKLDECFLNYIYYVAELLNYKEAIIPFEKNFENLEKVFSQEENVLFLFNSLDLFVKIKDTDTFFAS